LRNQEVLLSYYVHLREDQWLRIKDTLPGKVTDPGRTAQDNRRFVEAVMWVGKDGGAINPMRCKAKQGRRAACPALDESPGPVPGIGRTRVREGAVRRERSRRKMNDHRRRVLSKRAGTEFGLRPEKRGALRETGAPLAFYGLIFGRNERKRFRVTSPRNPIERCHKKFKL
jgi:hypothetical protein